MHVSTIFSLGLAEIFGVYLFIMAVVLYTRREHYFRVLMSIKDNNPVIFFSASIGLMLGTVLVGLHGGIFFYHQFVITVLCWLVFIKSLLWLMMPEKMLALTKRVFAGKGFYFILAFMTFLGLGLVFRGSEIFIVNFGS